MATAGFGEHLRREREMRGVSLEEIAGATRISKRFLEALETETWDRLPGGVFNRGFVRTVARFLGLEEESLLAEYSLAKGEPSAHAPLPSQPPAQSSSQKHHVPWLALAAVPVLLALAAGGWWAWQWIAARQAELNAVAHSQPAAPVPPSAPSNMWAVPEDKVPSTENPQTPASPWSASAPDLHLQVDATRDTALTITSDDQPVFVGTISAGQSLSFSADTALTVKAQDAGAIHLELNGQDLAPIGPSGQPGAITLGPGTPADAGGHD
jgi:cytoskeleton protein RodZ